MNWKIESDEQKVGQLKLTLGKGCSSLNDTFWNKTRGVSVSNRLEDTTIKEDDMKDPRDRALEAFIYGDTRVTKNWRREVFEREPAPPLQGTRRRAWRSVDDCAKKEKGV